jgi:hypothetical protein
VRMSPLRVAPSIVAPLLLFLAGPAAFGAEAGLPVAVLSQVEGAKPGSLVFNNIYIMR